MSPKLFLALSLLGVVILATSCLAENSDASLNGGHGRKGRKHPPHAKEVTTQERKPLNPNPKDGPHKPPRDHGSLNPGHPGDHHDEVQDRDHDHGHDHGNGHGHDHGNGHGHDHDNGRDHGHHDNPRRPPHKGHPHSLTP